MTFGQAIDALKQGKKVARKGWNGKGMWLKLKPGKLIQHPTEEQRKGLNLPVWPEFGLVIDPVICMYTAQGSWQPGWLASQPDMLSEDWEVVE